MTNEPEPNTRPLTQPSECKLCNGLNTSCPDGCDLNSPQPSELVERLERIERDFQMPPSFQSMRNINAQEGARDAITYIAQLEAQIAKRQAAGDKLAGYAEHDSDCMAVLPEFLTTDCTCGLIQALTEWKDRA